MERKPEGYHQERSQKRHLQEGVKHLSQHDHIDSSVGELRTILTEDDPALKNDQHSYLPLPSSDALAGPIEVYHKYYGQGVEQELGKPIKHVQETVLAD